MIELQQAFRDAMRTMAATVNVVTIIEDGIPLGMTATAVSSLSADPPSLLVCVNQSASMHASLSSVTTFCVNVLHCNQITVAQTFSDSKLRAIRFETGGWRHEEGKPPYLPDAQASLICERDQLIAYSTHTICIGRVTEVKVRADVDPLVYLDGNFARANLL